MPRKTDASNPADWVWLARVDLDVICLAATKLLATVEARIAGKKA